MKKMKKLHLLLAALLFTLLIPVCKPTTIQAATLKAPKTLTVKQGRNNISVQWSKVSGAKGYVVYRKTSPSQGWKRLKVVKAPTVKYLDKNIASGKSYYYTVRPYTSKSGKNSYGSYNKSGRNTVYLKEPKVTATKSHKSVTLKWNKTTGASGYEVYRKSGNSGYSKLDATTALSYTDKNVEPSTKYTYAVRAYKKSGKTTFRSLYYDDQNLVSVKTNKEPEVTPEPGIDINDAVESKVYVNADGTGVIAVTNKSQTTYYHSTVKIEFYNNNNILYSISGLVVANDLLPNMTDYISFMIPLGLDYTYYKIKLNTGVKTSNSDKYYKDIKIGTPYIADDGIHFQTSNSSNQLINVYVKFVVYKNGIPFNVIGITPYKLNIKEAKEVTVPFYMTGHIENIDDVKIIYGGLQIL